MSIATVAFSVSQRLAGPSVWSSLLSPLLLPTGRLLGRLFGPSHDSTHHQAPVTESTPGHNSSHDRQGEQADDNAEAISAAGNAHQSPTEGSDGAVALASGQQAQHSQEAGNEVTSQRAQHEQQADEISPQQAQHEQQADEIIPQQAQRGQQADEISPQQAQRGEQADADAHEQHGPAPMHEEGYPLAHADSAADPPRASLSGQHSVRSEETPGSADMQGQRDGRASLSEASLSEATGVAQDPVAAGQESQANAEMQGQLEEPQHAAGPSEEGGHVEQPQHQGVAGVCVQYLGLLKHPLPDIAVTIFTHKQHTCSHQH